MKNDFVKISENIVLDRKSGLEWWAPTLAVGVNYSIALEIIAALGEGWRMPTCDEKLTIVDREKYSPAIDTEFFPDTQNDWYWTSTPHAWNKDAAVWLVDFGLGLVYGSPRGLDACVRAVRSSQ